MGPKPKPVVSAPPGRRPRPRRGPLEWLMIILGLTLIAGATTCLVQSIQCSCPTRVHCSDIPREKRKWPCLSEELDTLYQSIRNKIDELMAPAPEPEPDPRCR